MDIALLIAVLFLSQLLRFPEATSAFATGTGRMLLLTGYYWLARVMAHLQPLPRGVANLLLAGWLALLPVVAVTIVAPIPYIGVIVDVYGLAILGYVTGVLSTGMARSGGVTRRRLGLMLGAVGMVVVVTALKIVLIHHPLGTLVPSVLMLPFFLLGYLGIATPLWLRQIWQRTELYHFLRESAGRPVASRASFMLAQLMPTAQRAVGGLASAVAGGAGGEFTLTSGHPALQGLIPGASPVLRRAAEGREGLCTASRNEWGPGLESLADRVGASAVMVLPLATRESTAGLLLLFLHRPSLFPEDDLELLALITEQVAIAVAVSALLEQQQQLVDRLEETNRQLTEANRAKSAFLANMSHELRTPLGAIVGFSDLLKEEAAELGLPQFVGDLERIGGAGRHLAALVKDILDLTKLEAGRMDLHPEPVRVAALLQELGGTVRPLAQRNGNTLTITVAENTGLIHADLTRTRQVIYNLLSNATKFTEQGRIALSARRLTIRDADWIEFRVTDTGIGIAADQIGRLFQDFTQVDSSATRQYGGTGLGLSISRRLCRLMGGEIQVESEPGRGSTFTVLLPAGLTQEETA